MEIERYISNKEYNEALSECLRTNQNYFGLLLANIMSEKQDNNDIFQNLKKQLEDNIEGLKTEGDIIEEESDDSIPDNNPSLFDNEDSEKPPIVEELPWPPPSKEKIDDYLVVEDVPSGKISSDKPLIRVKVLCNWLSPRDTMNYFKKFSQGDGKWNNIQLVMDNDPDFFVVINSPPITENVVPAKTIQFRMEPFMDKHPEMWGEWANPDPKLFYKICFHKSEYNNNEWHLSHTYSQLQNLKINKTENVMSTVLSSKYKDPGHIKRVDFVKFCEKKGFPVHVYGSNRWEYKDYKGSLPIYHKDNAMYPYKYVFNVENNNIKNYYTEKLIDGIMAECLVFYSGCWNVKEFIDEKAFVHLELNDFEKDFEIVKKAIENNLWEERLPYIRKAKKKILEYLQFFPRLERIINKTEDQKYES